MQMMRGKPELLISSGALAAMDWDQCSGPDWVLSTRISGRAAGRDPIQWYFPCMEIKLLF